MIEKRKHIKGNRAKRERNTDLLIDVFTNQFEIEKMSL